VCRSPSEFWSKELQSLALDVRVLGQNEEEIEIKEEDEDISEMARELGIDIHSAGPAANSARAAGQANRSKVKDAEEEPSDDDEDDESMFPEESAEDVDDEDFETDLDDEDLVFDDESLDDLDDLSDDEDV
jgi:DNA-directed RNA polymerase subunit beta